MKNIFEKMKEIGSKKKMADFLVKQKQPYEFKIRYAKKRAFEFVDMCNAHDRNYHVSVGGLDSIVLFLFLRSIGIDCPGISVSYLEDSSIQKVHKALGIIRLRSAQKENGKHWTQIDVIREFGFPAISKEIAGKIETLQNPTEKNKTVRHAIITGETGEYGGFQKNSRMKLAKKWLEKFGGYENENEGVNYSKPDFKLSSKCCYYLKEKPCDDWAKENISVPFLGLMASEGGRREKALKLHGCNYWGKDTIRSAPFAIFLRTDLLKLALEMNDWYHKHWQEFKPIESFDKKTNEPIYGEPIHLSSIIPDIYGEIVEDELGNLKTTKAQRTGCVLCGFGIHLEKRPHRFDQLRDRDPKAWDFYMHNICEDNLGNKYGWGKVLDYIGVEWRPSPQIEIKLD